MPAETIQSLESFREAAPELRRPFTANAVKWKIQSTVGDVGQIVAYIDARLVIERLNALVPHLWAATFEPVEGAHNFQRCFLTVDGITRSDVGEGGDPKSRQSAALKRAAVHFGVGVSLYAIPRQWLRQGDGPNKLRRNSKQKLMIDLETERFLHSFYAGWLESDLNTFGPPIDHGDVELAVGDPEVDLEPVAIEGRPEPLRDKRALELRTAIIEAAKGHKRLNGTPLALLLEQAQTESHEALEGLLAAVVKEYENGNA